MCVKRQRLPVDERLVIAPEFKPMIKGIRYQRKSIVGKYTNSDGAENMKTIRPEEWNTEGANAALAEFATWRKDNHFVFVDGGHAPESSMGTPPSEDVSVNAAGVDGVMDS